ncbi:cofilin/tropomyosin-type actin-binding domain-containing protein [Rhizoctonia solani AG-1 IA]|uniref:Cofilin/tropomyosin-type actin-binding domain-containing protein n=1 Tax=Thanatephorus cucumeris (strain AG1-IA) TaxID=983506 RepID=L8WY02_THACA|nr:cofilin/tropomyosin-type actin-binding domain-containing protein [Rhizoctonia solani AG-1 IA]
MADVTQPEIAAAYENVRKNESDINWLVLKYESPSSDKLKLEATGTGGLAELCESGQLGDSEVVYAYVRVSYANDKESKREKFILISWIGTSAGVMRKVSVHLADVKRKLAVYSIEVSAREMDDLKEEPIVIRLRKAGGASYDGV